MLNFLCVLKRSHSYNKNDVLHLKQLLETHYTKKFNFICLSSIPLNFCEYILLEDDLPRFWSKLELFKNVFDGKTIYFDLDLHIQNNIDWLDDIEIVDDNFWFLEDYKSRKNNSVNSSLMAWSGDKTFIYKNFIDIKNIVMREYRNINLFKYRYSDQSWIKDQLSNTDIKINHFNDNKVINYYNSSLKEKQNADIIFFSSRTKKRQCSYSEKYKIYNQSSNFLRNALVTEYYNEHLIKKIFPIKNDINFLKNKILFYTFLLEYENVVKSDEILYKINPDYSVKLKYKNKFEYTELTSILNLTEDYRKDVLLMLEKDKKKLKQLENQ